MPAFGWCSDARSRPGADVPRKLPAGANASHHLVDVGALLGEVLSDTAYILTLELELEILVRNAVYGVTTKVISKA
jgi:hypothetical protein